MEHDSMLMDMGRVNVLGQRVDRLVSGHHKEIMSTLI